VPSQATVTGPPDFVGVGAQRCGTTWWFELLLGHPAIRPPAQGRKELHFFDRFATQAMGDADVAAYADLFPRRGGELVGEWTPRYMADVWTPRLLRRAAPHARILILLRDPIERYRSGVLHRLSRAPQARRAAIAADAIERGRYAWQVRQMLELFGPERVLVLQYERCRADTPGEYRRTLRFLGADDHAPRDAQRPRGTTTQGEKTELWPQLAGAIRTTLEPDVAELAQLVPDVDLALWPNFAHLAAAGAQAGSGG
jgi:Sulfotransferase domain